MTCRVCRYEWCWTCGMNSKGLLHQLFVGVVICELINMSYNTQAKQVLVILFVIFFPLVMVVLTALIVIGFSIE